MSILGKEGFIRIGDYITYDFVQAATLLTKYTFGEYTITPIMIIDTWCLAANKPEGAFEEIPAGIYKIQVANRNVTIVSKEK